MAKNITFQGKPKPFGKGGHFYEPRRHALQAKGFKTGRRAWEKIGDVAKPRFQSMYGLKNKQDIVWLDNWQKGNWAVIRGKEIAPSIYKEEGTITNASSKKEAKNLLKKYLGSKDTDRDGVPDRFDCSPKDPAKQDSPTTFQVDDKIKIVAEWKKARDGFNHIATLYVDGKLVDTAKVHYINRTWEVYEFQSVMQKLIDKTSELTPAEKQLANEYLKKDHTDWSQFKAVSAIAKLGDVMGGSQKEKNDWKARMLKAGLGNMGLEMPEDWGSLDEDTKQARLDKVIALLGKSGDKKGK